MYERCVGCDLFFVSHVCIHVACLLCGMSRGCYRLRDIRVRECLRLVVVRRSLEPRASCGWLEGSNLHVKVLASRADRGNVSRDKVCNATVVQLAFKRYKVICPLSGLATSPTSSEFITCGDLMRLHRVAGGEFNKSLTCIRDFLRRGS